MGNEISIEEKQIRCAAFQDSIYAIEKKIKNELKNNDITKKEYASYFLINQNICKKYPFLLNYPIDLKKTKNQIFDFNDLNEKMETIDCSYLEKNYIFEFPSNFIFISKDFMKIINIKEIKTDYEMIIGGDCLIIKGNGGQFHINLFDHLPLRFIVLYNEIKDNIGNEVNFLLYIKDKTKRKEAVNYILQNNLWKYFEKINYKIKEDFQKIFDEKKRIIGYLIRTSKIEKIQPFFHKYQNKSQNNSLNKNKKTNSDNILNVIILSFYQFDKLRKALNEKIYLDFNKFKAIVLSKLGMKLTSIKNYEEILEEILVQLDDNTQKNKEFYNQTDLYDEQKGLYNFMQFHSKGNTIQKLFLIPKQETIFCQFCKMKTYKFKYEKFIVIKNISKENLNKKIFNPIKEDKFGKFCCYCNGNNTQCSIENKFIDYPEILIILLYSDNNFSLEKNLSINNEENNVLYSLKQFIEAKSNLLYIVQNNSCHVYEEKNNSGKTENIQGKNAVVLFYQLIKKNLHKVNIQNNNINNNQNNQNIENNFKQNINMNMPNNIIQNNNTIQNDMNNMNNINISNQINQINNPNINMQQFNQNLNNNFNNMNFMMNNLNMNNMNLDNNININNNFNNQEQEDDKDIIFITFTFKKGKQIFLDINKNQTFQNAITQLEDKYEWLKNIKNRKYTFNNKIIENYNQTLTQLKIEESSNIIILD